MRIRHHRCSVMRQHCNRSVCGGNSSPYQAGGGVSSPVILHIGILSGYDSWFFLNKIWLLRHLQIVKIKSFDQVSFNIQLTLSTAMPQTHKKPEKIPVNPPSFWLDSMPVTLPFHWTLVGVCLFLPGSRSRRIIFVCTGEKIRLWN